MPKLTDKPKRTTKAFRISLEALETLDYMAKVSNQSRQAFIEKLLSEVFPIIASFTSCSIRYEGTISEHHLEIDVFGDSIQFSGEIDLKEKKSDKK